MRTYFLKSARVGYSVWKKDDLEQANQLWGNVAVSKYLTASGSFTAVEINDRLQLEIKNYNEFHVQYFPIYELSSEKFIGCCGLRPYDLEKGIYEIGFHLIEEYWGKGLGTEVGKQMMSYAIETIGVKKLFAGHHPNNIGSQKTLKKLGFTYIETTFYPPTGLEHPSYFCFLEK